MTNYQQDQVPQIPSTNQLQPAGKTKTSTILLIVAAALVSALVIGSVLSFFLFKDNSTESTSSKSEDPLLDKNAIYDEEPDLGIEVTGGIAPQVISALGPTDDIFETTSSTAVAKFPDFETPNNSRILGFNIELESNKDDSTNQPKLKTYNSIFFATEETDIKKLSSSLRDSIVGWGEPEIVETTETSDGVTTTIEEIDYETAISHVYIGITIEATDGMPTMVSIGYGDEITDAEEIEKQLAKYAGWAQELPFPEGGTFDSVSFSGGRSNLSIPTSSHDKDVNVDITFRHPGNSNENDRKKKIIDSLEGSNFSINDSGGPDTHVYVFQDSPDEYSFYTSYANGDDHIVSYETRIG